MRRMLSNTLHIAPDKISNRWPSKLNCGIPTEPRKTTGSAGSCLSRTLCDVNSTVKRSGDETRGKVAWSNDQPHELVAESRWRDRGDFSITEIEGSDAVPTR